MNELAKNIDITKYSLRKFGRKLEHISQLITKISQRPEFTVQLHTGFTFCTDRITKNPVVQSISKCNWDVCLKKSTMLLHTSYML